MDMETATTLTEKFAALAANEYPCDNDCGYFVEEAPYRFNRSDIEDGESILCNDCYKEAMKYDR